MRAPVTVCNPAFQRDRVRPWASAALLFNVTELVHGSMTMSACSIFTSSMDFYMNPLLVVAALRRDSVFVQALGFVWPWTMQDERNNPREGWEMTRASSANRSSAYTFISSSSAAEQFASFHGGE